MTKWRGIPTNETPRFEDKAITIVNRLGQKSMKLPRIDDEKRFAGFPGLAGTAEEIASYVTSCLYYVEPFAGTAKVLQEIIKRCKKPDNDLFIHEVVLNDRSLFVHNWLEEEFTNGEVITNLDFVECFERWNGPDTFFLFDGPWNKGFYNQPFAYFDRKSVREYDEKIVELCRKCRGKFIITSKENNKTFLKSGFKNKVIKSKYVVCGKYPKVLMTHNLEGI